MTTATQTGGAGRQLAAGVLWLLAVVPSAMGFWLVAGDMVGVAPEQRPALVVASVLTVGAASLGQLVWGYRLPVFEGPGAAYFAAVAAAVTAVGATGGAAMAEMTGGLLVAGVLVMALGLLRVDRQMAALFTPIVTHVFLLVVCAMVLPAGFGRAIERTGDAVVGTAAGWMTLATVTAVVLGSRSAAVLRPYALALALGAGTAVHIVVAGVPDAPIRGGLIAPELLPWGPPQFSAAVVLPFLLAGALAAVNTIASIKVATTSTPLRSGPGAGRRGLLVHGAATTLGAAVGNLVGTVARAESITIMRLIENRRRLPLALASLAMVALAVWQPFLDAVAAMPLSASASLLVLLISMLAATTLEGIQGFTARERRRVLVPAVTPTFVWLVASPWLGPWGQLALNPLFWGVVLAVVLERRLRAVPAGAVPA